MSGPHAAYNGHVFGYTLVFLHAPQAAAEAQGLSGLDWEQRPSHDLTGAVDHPGVRPHPNGSSGRDGSTLSSCRTSSIGKYLLPGVGMCPFMCIVK